MNLVDNFLFDFRNFFQKIPAHKCTHTIHSNLYKNRDLNTDFLSSNYYLKYNLYIVKFCYTYITKSSGFFWWTNTFKWFITISLTFFVFNTLKLLKFTKVINTWLHFSPLKPGEQEQIPRFSSQLPLIHVFLHFVAKSIFNILEKNLKIFYPHILDHKNLADILY